MKKIKVLFVCFIILFCGIVFNACGCSGDVDANSISVSLFCDDDGDGKNDGIWTDNDNIFNAKVESTIKVNYTLYPSDAVNTAITVKITDSRYVSIVGEEQFDNGVKGSFKLKCDNPHTSEGQATSIRIYFGNDRYRTLQVRVVRPTQLKKPTDLRLDADFNLVWNDVENAESGYAVEIEKVNEVGSLIKTEIKTDDAKLTKSEFFFEEGVQYSVKIKATNSSVKYDNSDFSDEYKFCILPQPKVEEIDNGLITFDKSNLSEFSSLISGCKVQVKADEDENYQEFTLIYSSIDSFSLNTIKNKEDKLAKVLDVNLQTVVIGNASSYLYDGVNYYSSRVKNLDTIRRLGVGELKLDNGDYLTDSTYKESVILWAGENDEISSDDYKYKITVEVEGAPSYSGSQTQAFAVIKNLFTDTDLKAGDYKITIQAVAKDNKQAKYINSSEKTGSFTITDYKKESLANITTSISEDGLLEVSNVDTSKVAGLVFEIDKNGKKEYVYSDKIINSSYSCDLRDEVDASGSLKVRVFAIGNNGVNSLGYVNAGVSEKTVQKLNAVSGLSVKSNRVLTWSYDSEEDVSFNLNVISSKNEMPYTGTVKSDKLTSSENQYSYDFLDLELDGGESYSFEVWVSQKNKVSSNKETIYNIGVKAPIDKNKIAVVFKPETNINLISWGSDENVSCVIGENKYSTNTGVYAIENVSGTDTVVTVELQVLGSDGDYLNSDVVTKEFIRTQIEDVKVNDGKLKLSTGSYYVEVVQGSNSYVIKNQSGDLDDDLDLANINYNMINKVETSGNLNLEVGKTYDLKIKKYAENQFSSEVMTIQLKVNQMPTFTIAKADEYKYKFSAGVNYSINSEEKTATKNTVIVLNASEYTSTIKAYVPNSEETSLVVDGGEIATPTYYLKSDELVVEIEKIATPSIKLKGESLEWEENEVGKYEVMTNNSSISTIQSNSYDIDVENLNAGTHEFKVKAFGNITDSESTGTEFYIDSDYSDVLSLIKSDVDMINASVQNGLVEWSTINGDFKFKFEGKEINAQVVEDGGYSYLDLSDEVSGEGEYELKIAFKQNGHDFYSDYSTINIKLKEIENIRIKDNKLYVHVDNSVSESCVIKGLIDKYEIKFELGVAKLYVNGSYHENLTADENYYEIDLANIVKDIQGNQVEITLSYSNKDGYLNTKKKFDVQVVKLNAKVNSEGNLEVSGYNDIDVVVKDASDNSVETNNKVLDFNSGALNSIAEGLVRISAVPVVSENELVLYEGLGDQEFVLAPSANLFAESGKLKFKLSSSEFENFEYEVLKNNTSLNVEFVHQDGVVDISDFNITEECEIKLIVNGKGTNTNVISNRRGSGLKVNLVADVNDIAVNTLSKTLAWNRVKGASSYLVTVGENEVYNGGNNLYELLSASAETDGLTNGVGSLTYVIKTIGNTINSGSEDVAYLNSKSDGVEVEIQVVNKYINGEFKNGILTWENELTNAKFGVVAYDSSKNEISSIQIGGNAFNIASLIDNEGVYLYSIAVLSADNVIVNTNEVIYSKMICLDSNSSTSMFDGYELKDGLIKFDILKSTCEALMELVNTYNNIAIDGQATLDLPNSVFGLLCAIESQDKDTQTIVSMFKNVVALVNKDKFELELHVDYSELRKYHPVIDKLDLTNFDFDSLMSLFDSDTLSQVENLMSITSIPVYVQLDEKFSEGNYDVQLGYNVERIQVEGLNIIANGVNKTQVKGYKPSRPYCPTNPAGGNAFINDGRGTLVFNYSVINDEIIKKYIINILSGESVVSAIYVNIDDSLINEVNQTATINLNNIFFKKDEEILEYNVVYDIRIAVAGDDKTFISNASEVKNCFAKLQVQESFVIENGIIKFDGVCSSEMLDYLSSYMLILENEENEIYVVEYNGDDEVYLEGFDEGLTYSARLVLKGDGYGIIDSMPFESGYDGYVYKLSKPNRLEVSNGKFTWNVVAGDGTDVTVKYLYRFEVETEGGNIIEEVWRTVEAEAGALKVSVDLPSDYDDITNGQYKIHVVSFVEGNNYFVRSDIASSEYYERKSAPSSFTLIENGTLSWSVESGNTVALSFALENDKNTSKGETGYSEKSISINDYLDEYLKDSIKIFDFSIFTEGNNNILNSATRTLKLKTLPKLSEIMINDVGELVLAEKNSVYLVDNKVLQSNEYFVQISGEFLVNNESKENAILYLYLPNNSSNMLEIDEFKCYLQSEGANNHYVRGRIIEGDEYALKVIPGNTYNILMRYVGATGELAGNELYNVSTNMVNRNATVLEKMDALKIVEKNVVSEKGLTVGKSYVEFEMVAGVQKYLLNVNNDSDIEIKLTEIDRDYNITSINLQGKANIDPATSKVVDGIVYINITPLVEEYRKIPSNFKLSVKAVGNNNIGLTCNHYSDECDIDIPSKPENLEYTSDLGEVKWNSESDTKFELTIIYGVGADVGYVSKANYGNIQREEVTVENPTVDDYYKDVIIISKNCAIYETNDNITVIKYYLNYMCDEIRSIEVAGLSDDETISSESITITPENAYCKTFAGGDGTESYPFEINDGKKQFGNINYYSDKHFKLTSDIEVSSKYIKTFSGKFYGNSKKITINGYQQYEGDDGTQISLIGKVLEGAIIQDLTIDIAFEILDLKGLDTCNMSLFVYENCGTIQNIIINQSNSKALQIKNYGTLKIASVVFSNENEVKKCLNNVPISGYINKKTYIGGIAYTNSKTISKSGNNGLLCGTVIGGVVMNLVGGTIDECYNKGELKQNCQSQFDDVSRDIAGIANFMSNNASITNSYSEIYLTAENRCNTDIFAGIVVVVGGGCSIQNCYVYIDSQSGLGPNSQNYLFYNYEGYLGKNLGYHNITTTTFDLDSSVMSDRNTWLKIEEVSGEENGKFFYNETSEKVVLKWERN